MESPLVAMPPGLKMGDFDSCRFDFRIDTKSGLTPSRRKRGEKRNTNYNTLFKCKTCGSLFESRPALLDHKVLHNEFRCIVCDCVYHKKALLDEHMMVTHGMFNKYTPSSIKMAAEPSQNEEDDEIVVYPQSTSTTEIIEEDDDDEEIGNKIHNRAFTSPPAGSIVKTFAKSPVQSAQKMNMLSPSLPPLVSVESTGSASPSLPSTAVISAAVQNIFSTVTPKTAQESPEKKMEEEPEEQQPSPKEPTPVPAPSPLQISPQRQTAPAMVSPQPMMFSPMAAFPQFRYAFPQQMMSIPAPVAADTPPTGNPQAVPYPAASNTAPSNAALPPAPLNTALPQAPSNAALPPGYVYINVPMFINPGQQPGMPQLISAMPMPTTPVQPAPPQPVPEQAKDNTQKSLVEILPKPEAKRKLDQADSTTSTAQNKRKCRSPENETCLVIQDPRSLSSTDYEQNCIAPIKIEPTSPEEIHTEALDFTYKQDPVRQDVNISQANTKEDNPLNADVVDLCNSPDKEMDFEDDRAAMLDQYRDFSLIDGEKLSLNPDESGVSKVDADSTSQTSSTKEDRNTPKDYSCDQCEFKAANGAFLTQHKAKAHKVAVKSGLNKLLGKLWQNKMKQPESEPELEPEPEEEPKPKPCKEEDLIPIQDNMPLFPSNPEPSPLKPAVSTPTVEARNTVVQEFDPGASSSSSYGMFKFHTCKVCKQLFDDVDAMWEHMGTHKELRKFKCSLCSFKAVCRDKLVQHKQAVHPEYVKNPWNNPTRTRQSGKNSPRGTTAGQEKHKAPESRASHHGNALLFQCPEERCTQTFRTIGGLKNHQFSHLEENGSNDGSTGTPPFLVCPMARCSRSFPTATALDGHLASSHSQQQQQASTTSKSRPLTCSLCRYRSRQRGSLSWHMKNRHGLEEDRAADGRTIYVDSNGTIVVTEPAAVSDSKPQQGQQSECTENSLTSVPSPKEIQARVDEVMQHSMPDEHQRFVYNRIDGLSTPGVISYANEPEEITIDEESGPLTIDKLALHDRLKEEEEEDVVEQPIDMSVKKETDAVSVLSNNSSSLDLSLYSGEVIQTLGAVPSGHNTPYTVSPCNTPSQEKKECTLKIHSISFPNEDKQHFTSVLKLKYVGAPGKEAGEKKRGGGGQRAQVTPSSAAATAAAAASKSFNCQVCSAPFSDASKMWVHRLNKHSESVSIHCDTCSFSAPSKEELQNHMLSTHGNELANFKAFICFICGKGYGTKSGLNHHMLRHSEEGPPALPCPFPNCKSKLHSKGSLKMHLRRQHGGSSSAANASAADNVKVVRCRFNGCGKTFNTTKHLKVHQMQHTGEMPLKCHLCDYACRQRNSMNWHMQSKHNLEKRVSEDGRHTYYV